MPLSSVFFLFSSKDLITARAFRSLFLCAAQVNYGIARSRLGAVGYGETQLLNTANTSDAHRVNRRIEARVSASVKEKLTK